MAMSKKETLISIAEQLCDLGIVVEKLAENIDAENVVRVDPTIHSMPTPNGAVELKNEETVAEKRLVADRLSRGVLVGEVVDPQGMLEKHNIVNPVWSHTLKQASQLMGVPEHTVRNLAEDHDLPHLMSTNSGRGPQGRARRYSWTVCVRYMANNYSGCHSGSVEALPDPGVVLLTLQEAATMLEVSGNCVTDWSKAGKINCIMYGARRYFFPSDVLACKSQRMRSGASGTLTTRAQSNGSM
jgi:hypothetical protein